MTFKLQEIPGLDASVQTVWKVRALVIGLPDGDRNPTLAALDRWNQHHPKAYKAIIKVMKLAAQQQRVQNQKHVKKSSNEKHGDIYEMIAYTDIARLFFFYEKGENGEDSLIICTHDYEKGVGDQDAAFDRCATLRDLYRKYKNVTKPATRRPAR